MKTLLMIALLLSLNARGDCLDPDKEVDANLIQKAQRNLTVKIFRKFVEDGKVDSLGFNREELWYQASDQATEFLDNTMVCKELPEQLDI